MSDTSRRSALAAFAVAPFAAFHPQEGAAAPLGGLSAATSDAVRFAQQGAGAVERTLQDKAQERVSVVDFGARGHPVDDTRAFAAALRHVRSKGGGTVHVPAGIFRANVTLVSDVVLDGAGMDQTVIVAADKTKHVVRGPTNEPLVRSGLRNLGVHGDRSGDADGINLVPPGDKSFWFDTIYIENVHVLGHGRHGIYVRGTASDGPFVQHLILRNVTSDENMREGLMLMGAVFETEFTTGFLTNPHTADGSCAGATLAYSPDRGGSYPGRVVMSNVAFANARPHLASPNPQRDGQNHAPALAIGAVMGLTLIGCSFEFADPAIFIDDFVFAGQITAIGCSAGVINQVQSIVRTYKSNAAVFLGWRVLANCDQFLKLEGGYSSHSGLISEAHDFSATVRTHINQGETFHTTVASGAIPAQRKLIALKAATGKAGDELKTIHDARSGTGLLVDGQEITLIPYDDATIIKIKHRAGNILLAKQEELVLAGSRPLTLVWYGQRQRWIEK
ncbi:glycoside hydrolase family 55 protein [Sphingomonas sp. IC-56]|uniref:glycoside hydrolase family 55 protein n=1 Tax=Sphingomonas sp. IC-56 TaxID=2898529 RepID=UPI001E62184F|nr:glycoside hydrolase family 55 protein [Sphingomonas sp. IC-56]MCD2323288.1 glycoside hydrolase family 55 protein [Sphingomonas sp. IC-56]